MPVRHSPPSFHGVVRLRAEAITGNYTSICLDLGANPEGVNVYLNLFFEPVREAYVIALAQAIREVGERFAPATAPLLQAAE